MKTKKCNTCGKRKKIDSFYIRSNKKSRETRCTICKNKQILAIHHERMKDPVYVEKRRVKSLRYAYKTRYGITYQHKVDKWRNANKKCEICGCKLPTIASAKLDHNHDTKQIRGVLCNYCNAMLASIENETYVLKATSYLNKYNAIKNPRG